MIFWQCLVLSLSKVQEEALILYLALQVLLNSQEILTCYQTMKQEMELRINKGHKTREIKTIMISAATDPMT